jgi:hypothetical protein
MVTIVYYTDFFNTVKVVINIILFIYYLLLSYFPSLDGNIKKPNPHLIPLP